MMRKRISFAGAGRVASALCMGFYKSGFKINEIASKNPVSGRSLAESCNAEWKPEQEFSDDTDIIIVAVPDHQIESVLLRMKCSESSIVVHTAGSFGMDIFPVHLRNAGVFYPLQTFTAGRVINFVNLPFFIEASHPDVRQTLADLAGIIGGKVFFSDMECRKMIHLAAVFSNNFANHMLTVAKEIALRSGHDFSILEPLVKETIAKAFEMGPELSQTGPAVRNDQITIKRHLEMLSFSADYRNVYRSVTESITKYYKSNI